MEIPRNELFSVLQEFNPWWSNQSGGALPTWKRSAYRQIWKWIESHQTKRSLLLSGARQVGKTTLFRQAISELLESGFPAANIVYITFDHPILKLAGLQRVLSAWEELYPVEADSKQFLFLDEIQYVKDWQTWLKHQVDFQSQRRLAVTGSAISLRDASAESGVGRWETIPLPTLSFREYLRLRRVETPSLPEVRSLKEFFEWNEGDFARLASGSVERILTSHFHDYLLRSGFPEPAGIDEISQCQRLLREDIIEKVLKRDMTALFGVRRVLELEKIFLYLCYHDGGILDISALSRELDGVTRQSAINFLDLFEATHLLYRLKQFGYGKQVLKGKDKVYLADAALPGAVLLLGRKLLSQPVRLGAAVETAFFKHVFTRFYAETPRFSYWRAGRAADSEVDLVAEVGERIVPFEVKYQDTNVGLGKLKGLRLFLEETKVSQGYAITQRWSDFKVLEATSARPGEGKTKLDAKILAVPAPLACYLLSPPSF